MKYIIVVAFLSLIFLLSVGCRFSTSKPMGEVKLTIDKKRSFLQELIMSENGRDTILFIDHDFIEDIVEIKISEKINTEVSIIRQLQKETKVYNVRFDLLNTGNSNRYTCDSFRQSNIVLTSRSRLTEPVIRLDRNIVLMRDGDNYLLGVNNINERPSDRLINFLSRTKLQRGKYFLRSVVADDKNVVVKEAWFRI